MFLAFPPDGDPYEIRTRVAGVRGRSLRPLDQRAIYILNAFAVKPFLCTVSDAQFGAPSGTRTRDTLIKSQVLYQLSYWCLTTHAKSTWKTERRVDDEKEHD